MQQDTFIYQLITSKKVQKYFYKIHIQKQTKETVHNLLLGHIWIYAWIKLVKYLEHQELCADKASQAYSYWLFTVCIC